MRNTSQLNAIYYAYKEQEEKKWHSFLLKNNLMEKWTDFKKEHNYKYEEVARKNFKKTYNLHY